MVEAKNQVGMLILGIFNILSCYIIGVYILVQNRYYCFQNHGNFGPSSNYPRSRVFWALMSLSYGTMPFFGLWDNIVRITEYSNRDMAGLSAFFSVMTLMFLFSANSIDYRLFGKCHKYSSLCLTIIHIIIAIFWLVLFLVPQLNNIAYAIYPRCMLPIAFPCAVMMGLYICKKRQDARLKGCILLGLALIMAVLGYGSLIVFEEGNALRMYGWYLFCWLSVLLLLAIYYVLHIASYERDSVGAGAVGSDSPVGGIGSDGDKVRLEHVGTYENVHV